MKARIYSLPIIFLLGFLLFMVTRQFVADLYWKMALQDKKQLNRAIGYLERCVALDDKNSLFHFSLGKAFLRKGIVEATRLNGRNKWVRKSIYEFHKAVDLEPSEGDYHFHLGTSYGSLAYPPPFYWGRIQNSFNRTLMLHPTSVRYLHSIGIYYLNEYHRLTNIVRTTEERGPRNNKHYMAVSKENYELSFRRLVDVNEEYLGKILSSCFSVTQEYGDLKAVLGETARSHALLARFLNGKGMWEEARKEFLAAINLEPDNPRHCSDIAHALLRRGDVEQAIYWWQKQKEVSPRDKWVYLSLTNAFVKLRRFDDALKELRDLITLYPENMNHKAKLIRTLLASGRLDEAIDEYYKVMEGNQNLSKSTYDAIREYRIKGDYAKAIKILNESLTSALKR